MCATPQSGVIEYMTKSGTLTTTGEGGGGKPLCGGHHPKVPLFFDAAPKSKEHFCAFYYLKLNNGQQETYTYCSTDMG